MRRPRGAGGTIDDVTSPSSAPAAPRRSRAARLRRALLDPRHARVVATVLVVVGTAAMLWPRLTQPSTHWLLDLDVYRSAGVAVREGEALYEFRSPWPQLLPFTYPPFSGLLAVVVSLLPRVALGLLWTAGQLVVVAWLAHRAFGPLIARFGAHAPLAAAGVFVGLLWLTPIRDGFYYGQVNLFLLALVVADVTSRRAWWPRGALIGIAAAVKLTPGIFIPFLWLAGRRRDAVVAAVTFVGAQLLAFALMPANSITYWTETLLQGERLGLNAAVANQSLRGLLLRLDLPDEVTSGAWLVLALAVGAVGLWRAKRAYADGDVLFAVGLVGLTAGLVSPVSWIHHFVWVALLVGAVIGAADDPRRTKLGLAVALGFLLHLPWFGRAFTDGAGSFLVGRALHESFVVLTLVVVCALPWRRQVLVTVDESAQHERVGARLEPAP